MESEIQVANLRIQPSFLAPRPLGRFAGETSAPKRQKIRTDDVNQCLHNQSDSHRVANPNLLEFMFLPLYGRKVLISSANKRERTTNASSREVYSPRMLTILR